MYRKFLLPALILSGIQATYAYPRTYELSNETDTLCVTADHDLEAGSPFDSDPLEGNPAEEDTVFQSTEDGITQYRAVYNNGFAAKMGVTMGGGSEFAGFEQYDYPNSVYGFFEADLRFTFEKGNRTLRFLAYRTFLVDYTGTSDFPAENRHGVQVGQLFFMDGYQDNRGLFEKMLVVKSITDGVAECRGTEKAWNFPDPNGEEEEPEEPSCDDGSGHDDGHHHGHHKWGRPRHGKSHSRQH